MKKIVSSILLALILSSILTITLKIKSARAEETIYIMADGSVHPSTAPIMNIGNVYYTFITDIYEPIVVWRSNIIIDGTGYNVQGTGSGTGMLLENVVNVTVKNVIIKGFYDGMMLRYATNNKIIGNKLLGNVLTGIHIRYSSNNLIAENTVQSAQQEGIYVVFSSNNEITGNIISNTNTGIYLGQRGVNVECSNHKVTGNSLSNNFVGVYSLADDSVITKNIIVGSHGICLSGRDIRNVISENEISGVRYIGIELSTTSKNNITGNKVSGTGWYGIMLRGSSENTIARNTVSGFSLGGIRVEKYIPPPPYPAEQSMNNKIFHNNFVDNTPNAYVSDSINIWDNGYPSGGNYWSDYTGLDENGDGIGDTPYIIDSYNIDRYPLMKPWTPISPAENRPPNPPTNLGQFKVDGCVLDVGATAYETTILFKGTMTDPDGDKVKFQVELRRLDEYGGQFNEAAGGFKESEFVESGTIATAYACGLIAGDYHWRARTIDEHGLVSEWADFGNNPISQTDFIVPYTIDVSPSYAQVNLNDPIVFNGRVTDRYGNGAFSVQVGVDDPIIGLCTTTTTDANGYFSYFTSAKKAGSFLFGFFVGSITITSVISVDLNAKFSAFPELKIQNLGEQPVKAILYLGDLELGSSIISAGSTEPILTTPVFDVTKGVEIGVPLTVGGAYIDSTGTWKIKGGEAIIGTIYWKGPGTIGVCIGPGGGLYGILQGSGALCIGTDGISLVGSGGVGMTNAFFKIKIISFESPSSSTSVKSPVTLMITDPTGNRVGYNPETGFINEIDGATYTGPHTEPQEINIPRLLEGNYKFEIIGTRNGNYTLSHTVTFGEDIVAQFNSVNIPISLNEIHQYTINGTALSLGEEGVTVQVDSDGDGVFEYTFTSDSELTQSEYIIATDDIPPETSILIGYPKFVVGDITYLTSTTPISLIAEDDSGSGVALTAYRIYNASYDSGWINYTESFYLSGLSDGIYYIDFNSTDYAGNVEPTNTITVILDNTPPETTIIIGEPKYASDTIYVTPETPFTLDAGDGEGSGILSTTYRIYNSTYDSGWLTYTQPFYLTTLADGIYTIEYYSTDNLGNVETTKSIQTTLFSWNYIFTDSYGRGTTLKINLAHKFIQFIAPDKDYGIRNATCMRVYKRAIIIYHNDNELKLATVSIDTQLDFCIAYAKDIQTGKEYWLIDKVGNE